VEEVDNLYKKIQQTFGRPTDVLLNNAGYLKDDELIGETPVEEWWKGIVGSPLPLRTWEFADYENQEVNLKGGYIMTHGFIQAQSNPKAPVGTIITVASGRAGLTTAGGSAYNISKLAEQRLNEHLQVEYPTLRVFTTMPGISKTEMATPFWIPYALDHVELTGMLALYLAQDRADYLKGGMVGVNWDVEELEDHKEEIVSKKALWTSWLPILPFNGGKGLGA
jgi:NAD(P)-dependent dehydrogenase (short-subunit alcohol dehydrogenase family)